MFNSASQENKFTTENGSSIEYTDQGIRFIDGTNGTIEDISLVQIRAMNGNIFIIGNTHTTTEEFTLAQLSAMQEIRFNGLNTEDENQGLRFANEYQVIAYIATRDVELSLRFDSIGGIVQYFTEHPQELYSALMNLITKNAGNELASRSGAGSTYPALTADLEFCLRNIYQEPSNNRTSADAHDFATHQDHNAAGNDPIGSASLMDYLHHGDGKI